MLAALTLFHSNTYLKVKSYSNRIWKFQRYLTIVEYEMRPVLPPPLIIFSHLADLFRLMCKKRKSTPSDRGLSKFYTVLIAVFTTVC